MAQLSSNMKMCYPILVTGNIIVNTFDLEMGPDDPGLLFSKFSITKVQTWKCPLPAARWSSVKLSFLLEFLSLVILTIIIITGNTKNKNQRNENRTNPLHNAAYWGIFQNHWKYEERNTRNANGTNPFHNAQFTRNMINKTKFQVTKMAPPYFTMQHIGGSFQNDKKITGNMKKKIQEMKMAPTHFTM